MHANVAATPPTRRTGSWNTCTLVLGWLVSAGCQSTGAPPPQVSAEAVQALRVQVLDGLSGGTLPHARVTLDERVVETDAHGVATLSALPAGASGLSALPAGASGLSALSAGAGRGSRLQVEAAGFVPALWLGFTQRSLVVRLRRAEPPSPAQGTLVASVHGSAELPPLSFGHVRRVFVGTTLPAAQVTAYAGPLTDFATAQSCELDATGAGPCEVTLRTRVGRQRVYGWVVDSVAGAASDSRLAGLVLSQPIEVSAAAGPVRVELYALAEASLVSVSPRLASLQDDLAAAPVGVPGVKLDDGTGVMLLPSVGGEVWLPRREKAFRGAGYWMLAEAHRRDQGDDVRLRMVARKLSLDGFVLDHWSAAPARPRFGADGRTLLLPADAPRALCAMTFTDEEGALVADVVLWGPQHQALLPDAWRTRIASVTLWAMETQLPADAEPLDVSVLQAGADAILSRTTRLR